MKNTDKIAAIITFTAERYGHNPKDILSQKRPANLARHRQMAMFACRVYMPTLSLVEIGMAFGGRDHGTVIHAIKVAKADPDVDIFMNDLAVHLHNLGVQAPEDLIIEGSQIALLDKFAAASLAGMNANPGYSGARSSDMASDAYEDALAMLRQREKALIKLRQRRQ